MHVEALCFQQQNVGWPVASAGVTHAKAVRLGMRGGLPGAGRRIHPAEAHLDDMIQRSTMIVHGTAQVTSAAFRGSMIYTHYSVQVSEDLEGTCGNPGGRGGSGRIEQRSHQCFPGRRAGEWPGLRVVPVDQQIRPDTGDRAVARPVQCEQQFRRPADCLARRATETMLNASGQVITDINIRMTLAQMSSRIQAALAGGSGQ